MRYGGILLASIAACSMSREDGEPCTSSDECSSGMCGGHICVGSTCSSDSDCPDHFVCYHYDSDPIFGIGGSHACRMTCEAGCPDRWECDGQYCEYAGPMLVVAVSSDRPRAHETVHFVAAVSPATPAEMTWDFYSLGMEMGAEVDRAFEPGTWDWHLSVDIAGDGRQYANGTIVACPIEGDVCDPNDGCCDGLTCTDGACR